MELRVLLRLPASYPQARPSIRLKAVKGLSAEDCVVLQSLLTSQVILGHTAARLPAASLTRTHTAGDRTQRRSDDLDSDQVCRRLARGQDTERHFWRLIVIAFTHAVDCLFHYFFVLSNLKHGLHGRHKRAREVRRPTALESLFCRTTYTSFALKLR